jgi:CBS domain-containing protein
MEINDSIATILQHKGHAAVQAVAPDTLVYEAIRLMADRNIGCVLVMDGARLLGILSERDYTRKVVLQGRSSKITTVQEIMTRDVICVTPQHGVEQALRLITEKRVRHLPVIERGRVTGLISIGDLVKWVIHAQRSALSQLEAYVAGGYPG